MRHLTKGSRMVALSVAGLLALAACGGTDDSTAQPENTRPAGGDDRTSEPVEPTETEAASETEEPTHGSGDPYSLVRDASGHMPGTAAALAGAIATQNGLEGDTTADAEGLRQDLTHLLTQHVYLASNATGAALRGDDMGFQEAAAALGANTQDLTDAITSVYGEEGGQAFKGLWEAHIGFFVEYTQATAAGDEAGREAAAEKLDGYRSDFGAFIESATEGTIPAKAVEDALKPHVESLFAVIDAQASDDPATQYELKKVAAGHMPATAAALAGGIAQQNGLEGDSASAAGELLSGLTYLLDEHVFLATDATGAALRGETAEFEAAAAALGQNTQGLTDAVTSVYGEEGGQAFEGLWEAHIGFFVEYTQATAAGDEDGRTAAAEKLDGYRTDFGAFIESATEGGLPQSAVADALKPHVESLFAVIDAQANAAK